MKILLLVTLILPLIRSKPADPVQNIESVEAVNFPESNSIQWVDLQFSNIAKIIGKFDKCKNFGNERKYGKFNQTHLDNLTS